MPFFSIITPTYNRAGLVRRAIDSALAQDERDWELIVIDSASTDGTRDVVREYAARDPRVRLVCEEARRGVCPARNVAIEASSGEWIVPLDSDDELPPGTLTMFRNKIAQQPGVDQHRFNCRWDDGSLSPRPPLAEDLWDYEGYLRFVERSAIGGNGETMACVRASTFRTVRYPDDRSYETLYHLDFAKTFRSASHPEVARLYHTDAPDQNSYVPNPAHWMRIAPDHARSLTQVLARHGEALQRIAPHAYRAQLQTAAKMHFLAGDRKGAFALLRRLWSVQTFAPRSWAIFAVGIFGRRAMAWGDALRGYLRRI